MSLGLPGLPDWPWPWPDGDDPTTPPEPTTHYVQYPDGHISQITATGAEPVLAEGAKLLTQEQYEETRAQMLEAHEARLVELQAGEEAAQLQQYKDLRAVGLPEATARSLSGYTGQAVAGDAQGAAQTAG
ncbi:hypothetical protein [Streptomyces mirabilis]|uniref:hypothetical protein n=1 Tax=Streptomyces mirabilis TaxID=68239 RepID=UPI00339EED52